MVGKVFNVLSILNTVVDEDVRVDNVAAWVSIY